MEKTNIEKLDDVSLIKNIQFHNDEESLLELHKRYKNMYFKQVHKFSNTGFFKSNNISKADMINDSVFVIYDSAKTYDFEKNIKYITWLGNKSKFYFLNKSIKKDRIFSLMEFKDTEKELDEASVKASFESSEIERVNSSTFKEVISVLKSHPDKRIKKVFEKRYSPESQKVATWKTISKDFNLSSQTIINLHNKGINFLRKKIEKFI